MDAAFGVATHDQIAGRLKVALGMREQGTADNDLFDRLAADPRLGLTRDEVAGAVADPLSFTGAARDQVASVVARVKAVADANPSAAAYSPGDIL